jgi:hypothetical protein
MDAFFEASKASEKCRVSHYVCLRNPTILSLFLAPQLISSSTTEQERDELYVENNVQTTLYGDKSPVPNSMICTGFRCCNTRRHPPGAKVCLCHTTWPGLARLFSANIANPSLNILEAEGSNCPMPNTNHQSPTARSTQNGY